MPPGQHVLARQSPNARRWTALCQRSAGTFGTPKPASPSGSNRGSACQPVSSNRRSLRNTRGELLGPPSYVRRTDAEILTASDYRMTDSKNLACAVCRRWFTPRRSTAHFCGPRCRQSAHRCPGFAPVDKLKRAKRNVNSYRSPCVSATWFGACRAFEQPPIFCESSSRRDAFSARPPSVLE